MPTKWEINKAVRGTNMPALLKLVMLTLSDVADVDTAIIPAEYTPSLNQLADWTGMGVSSVKRSLTQLEELGWVRRFRPTTHAAQTEHAKTTYALSIGHGPDGAKPTLGQDPAHTGPSPNRQVVNGMVHTGPGMAQGGPRLGPDGAMGSAQGGPVPYIPDHYQISPDQIPETLPLGDLPSAPSKPKRTAKPKPPDNPEDNPEFMTWYRDAYPKPGDRPDAYRAWLKAIKKIPVAELLELTFAYAKAYAASGQDRQFIPLPATWLNKERWRDPLPKARESPNGYRGPYRNPEDPSKYDEDI